MLERQDVIYAFRYMFGRDPESEATIDAHLHFPDWSALRKALQATPEYMAKLPAPAIEDTWVMTRVFGGKLFMWINLSDLYVSRGCLADHYEPAETAFVRKHLRPGETFVDIGANIGWFTLLASTIVGSEGRVHSFEPRPDTFHHLSMSISQNALQGIVTAHNVGLSDREEGAFINSARGTDNPGGSFVSFSALGSHMVSSEIRLLRFDSYNIGNIDFIKIDVEGFEPKVLAGAMESIKRYKPVIMTEINSAALQGVGGISADAFIRQMIDLGYRAEIIDGARGGEEIRGMPSDWTRDIMNIGLTPT